MKIRHVKIEHFRGIESLDWKLGGDFVCLIGPGDSTKSTILDAIELALTPRWNVSFYDTDFRNAQTDTPIRITVTVGDLPQALKSDAKYGYYARGWGSTGVLHDEPINGDEFVLSVQLRVDSSLEPGWFVVNDRDPEGKRIGTKDREELGCVRLGEYVDRHFSWGRGTVLSKLTASSDELSNVLAEASRETRNVVKNLDPTKLQTLHDAAAKAKKIGALFGVNAGDKLRPGLDAQSVSVSAGGLSLHDEEVPMRMAGLGTRRLMAIAMQHEAGNQGGVTLIDEVETALEPHRLRRLLQFLKQGERRGTVIMTTHAPVVLQELNASDLRVVRSTNGVTELFPVDKELQPLVIKSSEAFLARKILVCEGKTELGFCRGLNAWWTVTGNSFGYRGIALADGGGTEAPNRAMSFAKLKYEVALFADSDQPLKPDIVALEAQEIAVIQWADSKAIEERIVQDLPWKGVAALVQLAMDEWGADTVRGGVNSGLTASTPKIDGDPAAWNNQGVVEAVLRGAIAEAAKNQKFGKQKGWFKRVDLAEAVANIVVAYWSEIVDTDLHKKIVELKDWAHSNE